MADLTIPIIIPEASKQALIRGFARAYKYQATVDDGEGNMIPNPISKARFMRIRIRKYLREILEVGKASVAKDGYEESVRQAKIDAETESENFIDTK